MDEIEIMQRILRQWNAVQHQKELNQELYNMLSDSLFYLLRHAEKHSIELPNKEGLNAMVDRIHSLMDTIDTTPIRITVDEHPEKEHYLFEHH